MRIQVLDPTYGEAAAGLDPAARLDELTGTTIGIISNGKRGTLAFFDALEAELRTAYGVADVVRVVKPNYSAPAGDEIFEQARDWQAVIAGIGD